MLCDRNHPAATIAKHTTHGHVIYIQGANLKDLSTAALKHFPLDTFVDAPVTRMLVVGEPDKLVQAHYDMQVIADKTAGKPMAIRAVERFAFYAEAKNEFAVVQTTDAGPYGCFLLKKGVL